MSDEREPPTPELNIDEKFAERMHYQTRIATLERDLAAAQAERDALKRLCTEWETKAATWMASPEAAQKLQGYRDLAQRVNKADAEAAALRADAERYKWLVSVAHWPDSVCEAVEYAHIWPERCAAAIDQARGAA